MPMINTKDEFSAFVETAKAREGYKAPQAFAIGLQRSSLRSEKLDVWYPFPNFQANHGTAATFAHATGYLEGNTTVELDPSQTQEIRDCFQPFMGANSEGHHNVRATEMILKIVEGRMDELTVDHKPRIRSVVTFISDLATPPESLEDVYLRLHLLSHRLVKPNSMNLDGIFKLLPNIAWTSEGPLALDELDEARIASWKSGRQLTVISVDKFPRMVDYVVPSGVRIADADRVRLGAYLGEGTTVMHEGFVNFNAGTEGPDNMVEGRISAGVWVGAASDLGGSASTMGTLSGGGKERVSIGQQCLLGANSGVGIALGDRCTVEAGLYITAGMEVLDMRDSGRPKWVKAKSLSGVSDLLFRRNSRKGKVEVLKNTKPNKPNAILHTKQ